MNKNDETPTPFTPGVRDLAGEVVTRVLEELNRGMWRGKFNELTPEEKSALYAAIADGFNDEVE